MNRDSLSVSTLASWNDEAKQLLARPEFADRYSSQGDLPPAPPPPPPIPLCDIARELRHDDRKEAERHEEPDETTSPEILEPDSTVLIVHPSRTLTEPDDSNSKMVVAIAVVWAKTSGISKGVRSIFRLRMRYEEDVEETCTAWLLAPWKYYSTFWCTRLEEDGGTFRHEFPLWPRRLRDVIGGALRSNSIQPAVLRGEHLRIETDVIPVFWSTRRTCVADGELETTVFSGRINYKAGKEPAAPEEVHVDGGDDGNAGGEGVLEAMLEEAMDLPLGEEDGLDVPEAPEVHGPQGDAAPDADVEPGDSSTDPEAWALEVPMGPCWVNLQTRSLESAKNVQDVFANVSSDGENKAKDISLLLIDAEGEARVSFIEWVAVGDMEYRPLRLDRENRFIYNIPGLVPVRRFQADRDTLLCSKVEGRTNKGGPADRVKCPDWALLVKSVFETAVFAGPCHHRCDVCVESGVIRPWAAEGTYRCWKCLMFWHEKCAAGFQAVMKSREPFQRTGNGRFVCAICAFNAESG